MYRVTVVRMYTCSIKHHSTGEGSLESRASCLFALFSYLPSLDIEGKNDITC